MVHFSVTTRRLSCLIVLTHRRPDGLYRIPVSFFVCNRLLSLFFISINLFQFIFVFAVLGFVSLATVDEWMVIRTFHPRLTLRTRQFYSCVHRVSACNIYNIVIWIIAGKIITEKHHMGKKPQKYISAPRQKISRPTGLIAHEWHRILLCIIIYFINATFS